MASRRLDSRARAIADRPPSRPGSASAGFAGWWYSSLYHTSSGDFLQFVAVEEESPARLGKLPAIQPHLALGSLIRDDADEQRDSDFIRAFLRERDQMLCVVRSSVLG